MISNAVGTEHSKHVTGVHSYTPDASSHNHRFVVFRQRDVSVSRSNPFVMGAGVSKQLEAADGDHPMHRKGLRRLQRNIDALTNEVGQTIAWIPMLHRRM